MFIIVKTVRFSKIIYCFNVITYTSNWDEIFVIGPAAPLCVQMQLLTWQCDPIQSAAHCFWNSIFFQLNQLKLKSQFSLFCNLPLPPRRSYLAIRNSHTRLKGAASMSMSMCLSSCLSIYLSVSLSVYTAALIHSLVFKCIDGLRIKQTFLLLRQTAFK